MAAEAIGTALAVVGVLGQLFDGCVKAYGFFATASHADGDSQRLFCKVRIEEMRLVVWGRDWGVAEGRLEAHLEGSDPRLRSLACQILGELHGTVTDFKRLREKYGLEEEEEEEDCLDVGEGKGKGGKGGKSPGGVSRRGSTDEKKNNGINNNNGGGFGKSWKKDFSLRARWVIADKEKFTSLLRDLRDFNDGLERLFPASHLASFERAWTFRLLETAHRDLAQLSLLETAAVGVYPHLTASATLKRLRVNLDAAPQAQFRPTFALRVPMAALTVPQGVNNNNNNNRCIAQHESAGDVLVEWIDFDPLAVDERVAHVRRLDDLARVMSSASASHPDLRGLDCLGYTEDRSRSRYGLVYRSPSSSFSSLADVLADLRAPDLDDRVRLASTLALALWSLHSLDWLHKSLCSANVLFFPSASSTAATSPTASAAQVPDVSHPYLSGFDASRPDLDAALSVAPRNPSIAALHRHPGSLKGRPHCRAFDAYSLGLVLLEVGLWKPLRTYHKPHYSPERWRDKVVLAALVPALGGKVGRRYRGAVEMCLRAPEDMTSDEAGKLMETVVATLEGIKV